VEGGTAAGVFQTATRTGAALGFALTSSLLFASLPNAGGYPAATALGLLGATGLVVLALAVGVADVLRGRRPESP